MLTYGRDHTMRSVAQETDFNRALAVNSTRISALILPLILARMFSAKPINIRCYKECSGKRATVSCWRPCVRISHRRSAKEVYSFQKIGGTLALAQTRRWQSRWETDEEQHPRLRCGLECLRSAAGAVGLDSRQIDL